MKKAILITNDTKDISKISFDSLAKIIAVDGGANCLYQNNIIPDLVIGDLDSIDQNILQDWKAKTKIIKMPQDKDETDTELAIKYCAENHIKDVQIINSLHGRFDHVIGVISNLEYGIDLGMNVQVENNQTIIKLLTSNHDMSGEVDQIISLIPLSEVVEISESYGLKYLLKNEKLYRSKTRGISNILTKKRFKLNLTKGKLLVIMIKKVD